MPLDRRLRILGLLGSGGSAAGTSVRLCQVSVEAVGVTGAGVMLMSGDIRRGSLCSSDSVSARIEELQYTLGEGPCVDAYFTDRVVLEPDLADPALPRWTTFGPLALAAGARAVFGFPIRVGGARLGALNLYRDSTGGLSDDQHADALVMADVAARAVLAMQAQAPPGSVAAELEDGSDFHYVVHQAAGMISVQMEITVTEALVRLRSYAFAGDLTLGEVAADVVSGHLRID